MTGLMLAEIETQILLRKPDWVMVYGDTNSTLAGSLAAAKVNIPIAHVESGLRSFNRRMPEEVNRVLTDHISTLLLCPTHSSLTNLLAEGITKGVHHVGDVMYDAAISFSQTSDRESNILRDLALVPKSFLLVTVHRAENTNDKTNLLKIMAALDILSKDEPVIFPAHPRTRNILSEIGVFPSRSSVRIIDPISFMDMVQLEKAARIILTDSGGVQKEAYFHGTPCVTLRTETEWTETIEAGWNQLAGTDQETIIKAVQNARPGAPIRDYGNGHSSDDVVRYLIDAKP
jgi:UDP-GlcNAc3NAcA epimerase